MNIHGRLRKKILDYTYFGGAFYFMDNGHKDIRRLLGSFWEFIFVKWVDSDSDYSFRKILVFTLSKLTADPRDYFEGTV
jgi:hypothetical protein